MSDERFGLLRSWLAHRAHLASAKQERPSIDLHFSRNRHHAEHARRAAGINTESDKGTYLGREAIWLAREVGATLEQRDL